MSQIKYLLAFAFKASIPPSWPIFYYYALDHGSYTTRVREECSFFHIQRVNSTSQIKQYLALALGTSIMHPGQFRSVTLLSMDSTQLAQKKSVLDYTLEE